MKHTEMMKLHVSTEGYNAGRVELFRANMSDHGYAYICDYELTLDIPEFDVVQIQVDGIDKKIAKVRADAQVTINQLEQRKQELLAIGHDEAQQP